MRAVLRGLAIGFVLLGISAGGLLAQVVDFLDPDEDALGDRQVTWRWEPIPGLDPYFLGT